MREDGWGLREESWGMKEEGWGRRGRWVRAEGWGRKGEGGGLTEVGWGRREERLSVKEEDRIGGRVKWAWFRSGSRSGSGSMGNILDSDPAKWCRSIGSRSGSATLFQTIHYAKYPLFYSSFSSKSSWWEISSVARNWINSIPQTAVTNFAFSFPSSWLNVVAYTGCIYFILQLHLSKPIILT